MPTLSEVQHESEAEFQAWVIDTAQAFRWMVAHFRPALTERGWRTAVSGDGRGFPDLVLVRAPELLIVELKAEKGRLDPNQRIWLDQFAGCFQGIFTMDAAVWRPSDREDILARLT